MNRRTFLAGLAGTTAIVAAGIATPAGAVRLHPGYEPIRSWSEFTHLPTAAQHAAVNARWRSLMDAMLAAEDRMLCGAAIQGPAGERIDPWTVEVPS